VAAALIAILLLAAAAGDDAPTAATIGRIAWLTGCWETVDGDRVVRERWAPPAGGMMIGTGQSVVRERTTGWEYLRIEARPAGLVYVALPSGQTLTEFAAVDLTDSLAVFANPQHDFPQRIIYRRLPDGSLSARVEGPAAGFDLVLHRVACD